MLSLLALRAGQNLNYDSFSRVLSNTWQDCKLAAAAQIPKALKTPPKKRTDPRVHMTDYVITCCPSTRRNLKCFELFSGWGGVATEFAGAGYASAVFDRQRDPVLQDFSGTFLDQNLSDCLKIETMVRTRYRIQGAGFQVS